MRSDIDFDRLGITDDLMFGTVFQDPNLCQGLIELLLGIEVEKIEFVERQGLLDAGPLSRAGIDDLLVRDAAGNEYDVEMQNVATPGIARRARRYLTLVDTNMLDRGQRFEDAGERNRYLHLRERPVLAGTGSATTSRGPALRTGSPWTTAPASCS